MISNKLLFIWSLILGLFKNVFFSRRMCESKTRLEGKVVVITGANTGIGKETAFQLSLRGAKIIIGCRDLKKGETAINDIKVRNGLADITLVKLDLSSLTSVRQFVKTVAKMESKLDILINNAGVFGCPEWQTEDGFEMHFGTNHLGHFLLTLSLMPLLKNSSNGRVVNVSSGNYMFGRINFKNINLRNGDYKPMLAYANSKLANILFTRQLAKLLGQNSTLKTYCLHPGVIQTEMGRHLPFQKLNKFLMKLLTLTVEMGAQTTLYCALETSIENESGSYYDDCKRVDKLLAKATDDETAAKLWELSCDLVQLEKHLRI